MYYSEHSLKELNTTFDLQMKFLVKAQTREELDQYFCKKGVTQMLISTSDREAYFAEVRRH